MQVNCACRVPNASGGFPHGLSFLPTKIWQLWVTLMMIAPEASLPKMLFSFFLFVFILGFFSSLVLRRVSSIRTEWSWNAWLTSLTVLLESLARCVPIKQIHSWQVKDLVEMSVGTVGERSQVIQIFDFLSLNLFLITTLLPWLLYIWMKICFLFCCLKLPLTYWFKNKGLIMIRASARGGSCLKCLDFSQKLNPPFTVTASIWGDLQYF